MEKLIKEAVHYDYEASQKAYHYALRVLKKPWKDGEATILRCPKFAYLYAKNVLKQRWLEGEEAITGCEQSSYFYSKFVLKGRFPLFEQRMLGLKGNPWYFQKYLYLYAANIQKCRLPKNVEAKLSENGVISAEYAVHVMKKRWKAAEKNIAGLADAKHIDLYIRSLNTKDRRDFRTRLLAEVMSFESKSYSKWAVCHAKKWMNENENCENPVTF
jgi:hypothetical protein